MKKKIASNLESSKLLTIKQHSKKIAKLKELAAERTIKPIMKKKLNYVLNFSAG